MVLVGALSTRVLAADVLRTKGFSSCLDNSTIKVNNLNVQYDRSAGVVTFDVGGTSTKSQNVTASLTVTAYGKQVYQKDFDPCSPKIDQLCPGKCKLFVYGLTILITICSSPRHLRGQRIPTHTICVCEQCPVDSIHNTGPGGRGKATTESERWWRRSRMSAIECRQW